MKLLKNLCVGLLAFSILAAGTACSNTGKGAAIGGGSGAALGAGIGALIGKSGKSTAIGAGVGAAVGAGVGALIGNKMDKQQKELEAINGAQVEETTDQNGLQAIKVTFEGGILFPTGKSTINTSAQTALTQFATSLTNNPNTNVQIYGFTDNTGSLEANQKVSTARANAVQSFLNNKGVAISRLSAEGLPMTDYVASNDTEAGRAQNRRVEIYISANEDMIKEAQAEASK
jgi:outer membrane protein OmpA-like peptidoglycan-associated protein